MLLGTETIQEIVEFFKNYSPRKNHNISIGKARNNNEKSDMDTNNDNEYGTSYSPGRRASKNVGRELKGVKSNIRTNKSSNNLSGSDLNANNLKSERSSNKNKKSAASKNVPSLSDSGVHGEEGEWLQNTESSIDTNFALDAERTIPTFQLSCADVNNCSDEFQNQENNENKQGLLKKRNIFDVLDSDTVKNKIPFMHPDSKECTFRYNKEYKMCC